jgi:hypothetical protein
MSFVVVQDLNYAVILRVEGMRKCQMMLNFREEECAEMCGGRVELCIDGFNVKCCNAEVNAMWVEEVVNESMIIEFQADADAREGRPYCKIPWISEARPKSNIELTVARSKKTEERLKKGGKWNEMKTAMPGLQDAGFIEKCRQVDVAYLSPIFPVFKSESLSTKCRIVCDARTINEYMHVMNCEHAKLFDILAKWGTRREFVTTDLSKAYYRIGLHSDDRKFAGLYFEENYFRFARMVMGFSWSPSGLMTALEQIFLKNEMKADEFACDIYIYMDDIVCVGDQPNQLNRLLEKVKGMLHDHGFPCEVRKFGTILAGDAKEHVVAHNTLGYYWFKRDDMLAVRAGKQNWTATACTINDVARMVNLFFDPFGLFIELAVWGRILLRKLGDVEDRNVVIADESFAEVKKWVDASVALSEAKVARYLPMHKKIYVFCDASLNVIGVDVRVEFRCKLVRFVCEGATFG